MAENKLTEVKVRQSKPNDKIQMLADGGGLFLQVKKNGTKAWQYRFRFNGKQKTLSMGLYPDVSLKKAREMHAGAKVLIASGIDPTEHKQRVKRQQVLSEKPIFAAMAKEWWEHQKGTWTEEHANRVWTRIEKNVFPFIEHTPIDEVEPHNIIEIKAKIEKRDALDVAGRVVNDVRRVFSYAVQVGKIKYSPASEMKGVVKTRKTKHQASLPYSEIPQFLRDLDDYANRGRLLTKLAVELLLLTFVRSGELRQAKWEEFDFEHSVWRIPAERMKMKTEHLVPLSSQAKDVLEQIKLITGQYDLVFPSEKRRTQCMSDNTMRKAVFTMGYDGNTPGKTKCVPHGFRSMASATLNEAGFKPDAIERQLSHQERNKVRAAYIHSAEFMPDRIKIMQWWADHLAELKTTKKLFQYSLNEHRWIFR